MVTVTFNDITAEEAWEKIKTICHKKHEYKMNGFELDDDGDVTFNDETQLGYEDRYAIESTFYKCGWITPYFNENTLILGLIGARDDRYKLGNEGWIFYHQKMIEMVMRCFRYEEFTMAIDCKLNEVYDKVTITDGIF